MGERLGKVSEGAFLARLSGDEFAVIAAGSGAKVTRLTSSTLTSFSVRLG